MSEEVKRVGRDLAYEGTVIKVYKDHMKFANGNTAEWDFIHHDGAAAVVPVMDDGKILMVTQYRNALERDTLEIPAGKLDAPGEPGIECASRELEEETGYRSEDLEWLITLRTTVAFCDEKIDIYVAKNLIPSHQHLDEDEFINVGAYTIDELRKKIYSGELKIPRRWRTSRICGQIWKIAICRHQCLHEMEKQIYEQRRITTSK